MTRTLHFTQSQHDRPGATRLPRLVAQLLAAALVALALLFPTVTYAAHPGETPGDPQQDDVLAGVDKFAQTS